MRQVNNIFVVGPDGTGKTEISTRLSERLGIPRFKCPSEKQMFKDGTFKEHLAFDLMLPHLAIQTGLRFVSDRGYPCEWAYSDALGRETDWEKLQRIDHLWAEKGDALIVLLTMADWSKAREDDLVDRYLLPSLAASYRTFVKKCSNVPYLEIIVDLFGDLWADPVTDLIMSRLSIPNWAITSSRGQ